MLVSRHKLLIPPLPEPFLPRPHLAAATAARRIACLIAPAGYGKTTLLAESLAGAAGRRAWYTLDEADRDPTLLVAGLAAALGAPAAGSGAPGLNLAQLCRWLEAQPEPAVLILDDLHALVGAEAALHLLSDLLAQAPPDMRLCLATRSLPPLPALTRRRLLGQVCELGPADLALTVAESGRLLADLGCDDAAAAELARRSQGWPAALRLLAAVDVAAPAGGGALFEYLAAEVLAALPVAERDFVLGAAVLARWTPAACDFVLERADSAAALDQLRRARHLVAMQPDGSLAPHPLWLEFLRAELRADRQRHRALQRRAALWADRGGDSEAALGHALAAADPGLITPLLGRVAGAHLHEGHMQRVQSWLEAAPEAVLEQMPDLLLAAGEAMRRAGRVRWALRWLHAAVLGYAAATGDGMLTALCRLALAHGDLGEWSEAEAALRQVEAEMTEAGVGSQAEAALALAVEHSAHGRWPAATAGFRRAAELFQRQGQPARAGAALADLGARALIGAGQTDGAIAALHQARRLVDAATACDTLLAEAQILCSLGRWQAAEDLATAIHPDGPPQQALLCWLQARLAAAQGDLFAAMQFHRKGELCLEPGEQTPALTSAALLARGWLDHHSGNRGAALAAADGAARAAAVAGAPLYATCARDLLAACQPQPAPAATSAGQLQVDLLGSFRLRVGGRELPPDAWGRAQVRGLCQFLLLQPDQAAGREAILEAFWPEAGAEQSRGLLRVALHRLRKVLHAAGCALEATPEVVRLPPGSVGWLDLAAFREHLAAARRTAQGEPESCLEHCRAGRTLYRGDLLADAYWPWAEAPRERARRDLAELLRLWQVAARSLQRTEEAVAALSELVALEPGSEADVRELIRVLAVADRRVEALRHYRELTDWLRAELGLDPAPETRELVRRLLG